MTIFHLTIGTLVVAFILTVLQRTMGQRKLIQQPVLSFLQNATGALFIFSGLVKAVDPLGTAYKMEQYFAEFEATFADTSFSFLASWFPAMAEYAAAFSVFMIVLEMALGIMLIVGVAKRFTSWAFFLLLVFFTALTGFTYLTGFVPEGVNFFEFSKWGKFVATNMKVTDCGCFGDFIKLDPRVSFTKDLVLLIPGLIFLFRAQSFHQLTTAKLRAVSIGLVMLVSLAVIGWSGYTLGWRVITFAVVLTALQFLGFKVSVCAAVGVMLVYSLSNFLMDIPEVDFRPFREGANIAERKAMEEEAENNVEVLAYRMTNKSSGEVVELPFDEYLANYQQYPAEEWELEQVKSEPAVARTKVSDFEITDLGGNDITAAILSEKPAHLMLVAYRLYGTESTTTTMVPDSVFAVDTIVVDTGFQLSPRLVRVVQKEVRTTTYQWDEAYLAKWKKVLEVAHAAKEAGLKAYAVTAYSAPERIKDFQQHLGTDIPFFTADDILLKTIVRSNPGAVLWRNGTILRKWHYKTLPPFAEIQAKYLN
ncbi:MAG: hypothetical protein D6772_07875 [Bacteroidetes bacterium]|nr:MAG: hypothetical protein D6772_07875 [Bacteroidota bacterium]